LYKEKGLINSGGKDIKYSQEILELLEALWAPKKVAEAIRRETQSPLGKLKGRSSSKTNCS
jgi:hypothetical protein